jgi:hypothetical protein
MGTEEFKKGPLAYIGNNSYAGGMIGPGVPTDKHPVTLGLDISKAPRAGEEVTLSCRIVSLIDVPDFSIDWSFMRRLGAVGQDISETELLSSADLSWKIDIKKGEPVVFSTTFKFPTEGNWEIWVSGKSGARYLTDSGHYMKISITSTRSSFGWMEIPMPKTTTSEPPGTTTAIYMEKTTGPSPTEPQPISNVTCPTQWYQYDNDTKKLTPADSTTISKLP